MKITKLSIILCILLCLSYIFFAYSFVSLQKERVDLIAAFEESSKNTGGQYADDSVRQFFVKKGGEADFISAVEQACSAMSLECSTSSVNETEPSANEASIQTLQVKMSAEGSFNELMEFLKYLELSDYPIKVDVVNMNADEGEWNGTFEASAPVVPE